MPKPSSGCDLCRQRKVGCDFGRPECQRCIRYGVRCPGYRNTRKHLKFVVQVAPTWSETDGEREPSEGQTTHHATDALQKWRSRMRSRANPGATTTQFGSSGQMSPLSALDAGHVNRLQMLSTFGELFVPVSHDKTFGGLVKYVRNLSFLDLQNPLLQSSIDVLLLAGFGALHGDQRCLQRSTAMYSKALRLLSTEIKHASKDISRQRMVLSSIMMISFPYHFDIVPIPQQKNVVQDWLIHIRGAEKYLKCCGPIAVTTETDWLMFHNLRRCIAFAGVYDRTEICFASPQWQEVCEDGAQQDETVAFINAALHIPALLQRTDELLASEGDDHSIELLCLDIMLARKSLRPWAESAKAGSTPPPLTPPASEVSTNEDHASSKEAAVADAVVHTGLQAWAWNLELVLLCTLLRIQHFRSEIVAVLSGWNIKEEATAVATKLALNCPSCYRTGDPTMTLLAAVNLALAQAYFEETGMQKDLMWSKGYEAFMSLSTNMRLIVHAGAAPGHFRAESLQVDQVMAAYTIP